VWQKDATFSAQPGTGANNSEPEQYGNFEIAARFLQKLGVPPDFESDGPLRYGHRHTGEADIYFVANRDEQVANAHCTFRVSGKQPELWDPLTGNRRELPEFEIKEGRTLVPLRFEPAQSFFVVFRKSIGRHRAAGANFAALTKTLELSGPWEVAFDPKWGGPEQSTFTRLEDWSHRAEEGIRYYSGMATYRKSFNLDSKPSRKCRFFLDLGVVKNLARVRLNGKDLGVVWCAPWRVEMTDTLRRGENELQLTVANLWPNRLIGDQALDPVHRLTSTTWNPFKKDSPLLESGLLGPVTIQRQ
jgi:hypothetical protein